MNLDLTGKHAVVCGSTQGIGKASAIVLSSLGASVTLVARNETALSEVLKELDTSKRQQHGFVVADFSLPQAAAEKLASHLWSTGPAHILVNNTGGPPAGPILTALPDAFETAFTAHLLNAHLMVQTVLEGMKEAGYGRIINIISTSVKQPLRGLGVSNTIRGAVASWAKTLSSEVAQYGITVNNVLPGATSTQRLSSIIDTKASRTGVATDEVKMEMLAEIPAGRFALPEEIANAVAFLASPAAGYINGINLPVDGGRTGCL
jgi:3-oxoacyl-[acyl-carrier protein] reductase